MIEGQKDDAAKLRYDLIPGEAMAGLAYVYTLGADKYADRNWEKGIKFGRVFAALMRHAWSWWRGEEYDSDGQHHLDSVAWCAFALRTYVARGHAKFDDRPGDNGRYHTPAWRDNPATGDPARLFRLAHAASAGGAGSPTVGGAESEGTPAHGYVDHAQLPLQRPDVPRCSSGGILHGGLCCAAHDTSAYGDGTGDPTSQRESPASACTDACDHSDVQPRSGGGPGQGAKGSGVGGSPYDLHAMKNLAGYIPGRLRR